MVNLEKSARERLAALEREVGDRRQTEEQLRKTMQQLRQLAENITDAFWMRNVGDPRMVYVSPAYETIWGRSCKDLYPSATGWLDAVHPEDRERVAQAIVKQSAGSHYTFTSLVLGVVKSVPFQMRETQAAQDAKTARR